MSWGSDLLKDSDKNLFLKWITRFTLKRTTVLIGDCESVQQKAESFGFSKENAILFPWGINLDEFTPSKNNLFRERRGWHNNFVILSLRSWEPIYGVDVLAKAFSQAVLEEPSLRLILLGNGSQAQEIRKIFNQAGVSEDIFWGGQVSQKDLPGYYQSADLYISASHSDGSSVSLMESLGSGLPVLVSDIPGNKEWIQNQEHGWLFRDNDVAALKNGILNAFRHREELKFMSKKARLLAEKRADWNKNFNKLLEAYQLAFRLAKG
jgi:glycosyltransferase involved in cell wall biosynthesis